MLVKGGGGLAKVGALLVAAGALGAGRRHAAACRTRLSARASARGRCGGVHGQQGVTHGVPGMDLSAVVRFYIDKMLREVPGMKVLLLDADTTRSVSTVYSQSEILEQEVYLVERLDADKGELLFHLKARTSRAPPLVAAAAARPRAGGAWALQAVCFLRPTRENVARLRRELRDPRYGEYNLCAPCTIPRSPVAAFFFKRRLEALCGAAGRAQSSPTAWRTCGCRTWPRWTCAS